MPGPPVDGGVVSGPGRHIVVVTCVVVRVVAVENVRRGSVSVSLALRERRGSREACGAE